jgi:hypothetical protein
MCLNLSCCWSCCRILVHFMNRRHATEWSDSPLTIWRVRILMMQLQLTRIIYQVHLPIIHLTEMLRLRGSLTPSRAEGTMAQSRWRDAFASLAACPAPHGDAKRVVGKRVRLWYVVDLWHSAMAGHPRQSQSWIRARRHGQPELPTRTKPGFEWIPAGFTCLQRMNLTQQPPHPSPPSRRLIRPTGTGRSRPCCRQKFVGEPSEPSRGAVSMNPAAVHPPSSSRPLSCSAPAASPSRPRRFSGGPAVPHHPHPQDRQARVGGGGGAQTDDLSVARRAGHGPPLTVQLGPPGDWRLCDVADSGTRPPRVHASGVPGPLHNRQPPLGEVSPPRQRRRRRSWPTTSTRSPKRADPRHPAP